MVSALGNLLRFIAIVACLVATASMGLYAVNQTDNASAHQQETLATGTTEPAQLQTSEAKSKGVRGVIDETAKALASPFDGATASSNSEWVKRGAGLGFVLLVYGFGLGFIARFIRVRA
jgi:hypothetical protein